MIEKSKVKKVLQKYRQSVDRRFSISDGATLQSLIDLCGENISSAYITLDNTWPDETFVELVWRSLETDDEMKTRISAAIELEKRIATEKKVAKMKKDEKERAEYERLRIKFEKKNKNDK